MQPLAVNSATAPLATVSADMLRLALPVLVITRVPLLLSPILTAPRFRLVDEMLKTGMAIAVPVNVTTEGLPLALCATNNVAVLVPAVVGAKTTVIVQLAPRLTAPMQPLTVYSLALLPATVKLEIIKGAVPVFDTVKVREFVLYTAVSGSVK